MLNLTEQQEIIRKLPAKGKVSVTGPAGCGKTTAAVERMLYLIRQGLSANSILVLTPQRTLANPYTTALLQENLPAGGVVSLLTMGGLARRAVDLFWPLVGEIAGFIHFDQSPIFLTLETAQYHMAHIVRPLLDEGYFGSIVIDRNRLYSQIIDNLNKAASIGFPYREIGSRLQSAWAGDPSQRKVFNDVQECSNIFRKYCLENNFLDFSLQMEIFWNHLWNHPEVRNYLTRTYQYLIYDNPEEDTPRTHDIILEWLPDLTSALLVFDKGGGYRQFLGADAESSERLRKLCDQEITLESSFVMSPQIASLEKAFEHVLTPASRPLENPSSEEDSTYQPLITFPTNVRFFPQMIDWVSNEIHDLIQNQQIPVSQIAILAPFISDSLRFALVDRLQTRNVKTRSHRPSRSLRNEPASQALLTLAELAHPFWNIVPSFYDVLYSMLYCLQDSDLVRADLLTRQVYQPKNLILLPFDQVRKDIQERITFTLGSRYTQLRNWVDEYRKESPQPFDHFLRRLFGEVLSQPGFGFHNNSDAARVTASLIESVQKFRMVIEPTFLRLFEPDLDSGREYIQLLEDGVIAAQYLEAWKMDQQEAVLIAPAHTFLMMNQPVEIQFWLDPGSNGWVDRLYQPLTQTYVLNRNWEYSSLQGQRLWTDTDEVLANQKALARLVAGLLHRCRSRLFLGISNLGETGFEQRSLFLKAIQRVFQQTR